MEYVHNKLYLSSFLYSSARISYFNERNANYTTILLTIKTVFQKMNILIYDKKTEAKSP